MHYTGQQIAFLTQHGKDELLRSMLAEKLGCEVVRAAGFDTDQLGTFTRDVERSGTQLAAARFKAHKAIELTGYSVGLGSEGAFGTDPVGGIMPWNTEVLVWVDVMRGIEIVGIAQGPGGGLQRLITDEVALRQFANDAGFPDHGLVLRPNDPDDPRVRKGLTDWHSLIEAFEAVITESSKKCAFIELDLRAHLNPTRQKMILRAAENLVTKIMSPCPQCDSPGFWEKERITGLPCSVCKLPTRLPVAFVWRCSACEHSEEMREAPDKRADPARCDYCNP